MTQEDYVKVTRNRSKKSGRDDAPRPLQLVQFPRLTTYGVGRKR